MGHSLVQGAFQLVNSSGAATTFNMINIFNIAAVVYTRVYTNSTFLDSVIRGLVSQPSQTVDHFVTDQPWLQFFKYFNFNQLFVWYEIIRVTFFVQNP